MAHKGRAVRSTWMRVMVSFSAAKEASLMRTENCGMALHRSGSL